MLIPALSKDLDEQLKLAHKVVYGVDRPNRKIRVFLLRYKEDKLESSYAQVRLFATKKKEDGKFQQNVCVKCELEKHMYLLNVVNSLYDKVITNQPICNVLQKVISSVYCLSFFHSCQDELVHWR